MANAIKKAEKKASKMADKMAETLSKEDGLLLLRIGNQIKTLRKQKSLSLEKLGLMANLSLRYLLQTEQGQANISILKLNQLAKALDVHLADLVNPSQDLDLSVLFEQKKAISLLGVRGVGKSSVANALAGEFIGMKKSCQVIELDELIEKKADLSLSQIFSMYGEHEYRKLETEVLDEITQGQQADILIVIPGGSIVKSALNYQKIKNLTVSIYLSASAQDHWERVIAQGDHRPMQNQPKAFKALEQLLIDREPLYAQADLMVDTHDRSIDSCVQTILSHLTSQS
jgi:XRE family aerobic/anaerobic benzoate catabolism transcriptional regulator